MSYLPLFDTPDTTSYMIMGYVTFIALPIIFIGTLIYRYRNLKRDEETMKDLDEDKNKKS
jgi:hypothetical protein